MFDEAMASTCYQLLPQDISDMPTDWDSLHCLLRKTVKGFITIDLFTPHFPFTKMFARYFIGACL